MKKCPLRKETDYLFDDITCQLNEASQTKEYFLDCIGKECMAWNESFKYCEHLTNFTKD